MAVNDLDKNTLFFHACKHEKNQIKVHKHRLPANCTQKNKIKK